MLKNKVALISGGTRGIGKAIALNMAKNGADIIVLYSGNKQMAEDVVFTAKTEYKVKAIALKCDVADFENVKNTVNTVIKEFGGIDILVNNAGITADKLVMGMTENDFEKVIDVNLKGAFNMIRHTVMNFIKKRNGRIINISSVSGICGNAGQANYSSAKAGLIGLTKSVAKELASRNITCNAIAPGFIQTDMTDKLPEKIKQQAIENIPLKRMGNSQEIAYLATFLASDYASYITGEVIKIDGGLCI